MLLKVHFAHSRSMSRVAHSFIHRNWGERNRMKTMKGKSDDHVTSTSDVRQRGQVEFIHVDDGPAIPSTLHSVPPL